MKYMLRPITITQDKTENTYYKEIKSVINSPPETWKPYLQKNDYISIINMEYNELMTAINTSNTVSIKKECIHTLSAIMNYLNNL